MKMNKILIACVFLISCSSKKSDAPSRENTVPSVIITKGLDIVEASSATFTILIEDKNLPSLISYTPIVSSGELSPEICTQNPCVLTVSGATVGELSLTVTAGSVTNLVGNSNLEAVSDNLTVHPSLALVFSTSQEMIVTKENAPAYLVSGVCDPALGDVTVDITNFTFESVTSPCNSPGEFHKTIDVSLLKITPLALTVAQDETTIEAKPVNRFTCPENFVLVPALASYTDNSFCVMKYEAKNDGSGVAVSKSSDRPYVSINRTNAILKCEGMGEDYDLITNDEWQTLARNIDIFLIYEKSGEFKFC